MSSGNLAQYFNGVGWKRLKNVEVKGKSNQHEFNGIKALELILGPPKEKVTFKAKFIYLSDYETESTPSEVNVSWYDGRKGKEHRPPEGRLYYPEMPLMKNVSVGDLLLVAKKKNNNLLIIIAKQGSTIENQIGYLFGIQPDLIQIGKRCEVKTEEQTKLIDIGFAKKMILEEIGIDVQESADDFLEKMIFRFGDKFPTTSVFSHFARETLPRLPITEDPDFAIVSWFEREEALFRSFEKHIILKRLKKGFEDNAEGFMDFAKSVTGRRKSRAGYSLEHHVEKVLKEYKLKYKRNGNTENNKKPDFLFPGINEYQDTTFPFTKLTILGVKATCRDRWRQVLSEGDRVKNKHLLTLEPSISSNQTKEMTGKITLVIPKSIHPTYKSNQMNIIVSFLEFLKEVAKKQSTDF